MTDLVEIGKQRNVSPTTLMFILGYDDETK